MKKYFVLFLLTGTDMVELNVRRQVFGLPMMPNFETEDDAAAFINANEKKFAAKGNHRVAIVPVYAKVMPATALPGDRFEKMKREPAAERSPLTPAEVSALAETMNELAALKAPVKKQPAKKKRK